MAAFHSTEDKALRLEASQSSAGGKSAKQPMENPRWFSRSLTLTEGRTRPTPRFLGGLLSSRAALRHFALLLVAAAHLAMPARGADGLPGSFATPPDSARPGVYWYFMDGNLSREGMTRDLESMKAVGLGHLVFLEVNVGVPRGPVGFLSEQWQDLFAHAVREAERLGIEITLGSGPGWTGSGGPWVKPEQSMQHLVASRTELRGPGKCDQKLPVPPPRRPFFGHVPSQMKAGWEGFFKDVAVLAFPTPTSAGKVPDVDEKALVYRAPFSSQAGVKPYLDAPAEFPSDAPGSTVPREKILDLTSRLQADGTLNWDIPPGNWTVLRFVSRNNGASTRPAPEPGIGFECDKFDTAALDAHFEDYVGRLLKKVGPRKPGAGWTMLHIDSWEMGAQNWTPKWREEFQRRRGYDPLPFYPACVGDVVGSRELTERFLWDLRMTGSELVVENHAEHLKKLGRRHGFTLSIEPYDMNPSCDFDLGAVADVPMCEFWSVGFQTSFSVQQASSIAHIMGCPVVAAEAFTGAPGEDWKLYPGALKNQGDWAFASGVNRLTYHTFAHKPDEARPGMVMGPYGVHWDRGQTWWPMAGEYHRYIARCQEVLRHGQTVADVLYLMPEGAPNIFQPPASAFAGTSRLPDRRGYNFDGCSPTALMKLASVRDGRVVFPSGASYRMLVLPNFPTMTPELLNKLESLLRAGATVVGAPPKKSPSLVNHPACDREVAAKAEKLWGALTPPAQQTARPVGQGRIVWGGALNGGATAENAAISGAKWIWYPEGEPAASAPMASRWFRREFTVPAGRKLVSARLEMTADNSFAASVNGTPVGEGDNFHQVVGMDVTSALKSGANVLHVRADNGGDAPNPAGLIGALRMKFADGSEETIATDAQWAVSRTEAPAESAKPAKVLGAARMSPWRLNSAPASPALYPHYDLTADLLREMGVPPDFSSPGPVRYTHRSTEEREIFFVANRSDKPVRTTATFRVADRAPELWDPQTGTTRALPEFTHAGGLTTIPLSFDALESFFVVFPKPGAAAATKATARANFADPAVVGTLEGAWEVSFDPAWGAPGPVRFESLEDWTKRAEPGIQHYSGIATYRKTFDLPGSQAPDPKARIHLDLGTVQVMARVRVNGQDCGVAWTAPWRVDISRAVRATGNTLEIEVANLWPNRMIGDAKFPAKTYTRTTYRPFKASHALLPSGLLGPVRFMGATEPAGR